MNDLNINENDSIWDILQALPVSAPIRARLETKIRNDLKAKDTKIKIVKKEVIYGQKKMLKAIKKFNDIKQKYKRKIKTFNQISKIKKSVDIEKNLLKDEMSKIKIMKNDALYILKANEMKILKQKQELKKERDKLKKLDETLTLKQKEININDDIKEPTPSPNVSSMEEALARREMDNLTTEAELEEKNQKLIQKERELREEIARHRRHLSQKSQQLMLKENEIFCKDKTLSQKALRISQEQKELNKSISDNNELEKLKSQLDQLQNGKKEIQRKMDKLKKAKRVYYPGTLKKYVDYIYI